MWLWSSHLNQCLLKHLDYESRFRHQCSISSPLQHLNFCEVYECQKKGYRYIFFVFKFRSFVWPLLWNNYDRKIFIFAWAYFYFPHLNITREKNQQVLNELLTKKSCLKFIFFFMSLGEKGDNGDIGPPGPNGDPGNPWHTLYIWSILQDACIITKNTCLFTHGGNNKKLNICIGTVIFHCNVFKLLKIIDAAVVAGLVVYLLKHVSELLRGVITPED